MKLSSVQIHRQLELTPTFCTIVSFCDLAQISTVSIEQAKMNL